MKIKKIVLTLILVFAIAVPNSLASYEQVSVPSQELWHWEGGDQLDKKDFTKMIDEVLDIMPIVPSNDKLVKLLAETAATESSFGYAVKDKSGKTLGVYQILLTTAKYILKRIEDYPQLDAAVESYMDPARSLVDNLKYNLHFQTAMAVSYYWLRAGENLLDRINSLPARAKLYKQEWNTPKGAATVNKYIRDSKRYL